MRNTKKAISILLTLLMVVGMMSTFAFATSVTIRDTDGSTTEYEAYQILAGTYDAASKKLTNVTWGSNIGDEAKTALGGGTDNKYAANFANAHKSDDDAAARQLATTLATTKGYITGSPIAINENTNLNNGYYLVTEKGALSSDIATGTRFVLKVIGNDEITIDVTKKKTSTPTPDKKVKNETQTAEIGENHAFQFELSAELPDQETLDEYKTYTIKMTDTLSDGITFKQIDKVYYKTTKEDSEHTVAYTPNVEGIKKAGGGSFSVTLSDIKALKIPAGSTIYVEYTVYLNENAVVGKEGNLNTYKLEYSKNPNSEGLGEKEDTSRVYTGLITVKKYGDGDESRLLSGAVFVVKNSKGEYLSVNATTKAVSWIDLGTVKAEDLAKAYNNGTVTINDKTISAFVTGTNGLAEIKGLNAGTYKLTEIIAPEGYNILNGDTDVTLSAAQGDGVNDTILTMENTKPVNNMSGSTLPETGGIGTTIFYILGAILVIGAGVVFVTRRRMHSEK